MKLRNLVLLLPFAVAHGSPKPPPAITTWWPDPTSGLMWSGDNVAIPGGVSHAAAVQLCTDFRLGGYTDWRLPTVAEMKPAVTTYADENTTTAISDGKHGIPHVVTRDDDTSSQDYGLSFAGESTSVDIWTSEAPDATHFTALRSGTVGFGPIPYKALFHTFKLAGVYCVRPMDASMRTIAAAAHVTRPVSSLQQLQDAATLYAVERVTDPAGFGAAVEQAKSVLPHKNVLASQASNDAGFYEILEGQFAAGEQDLAQARRLDKNNSSAKYNVGWAKQVTNDAKSDAKTLTMWIALHKIDVERLDKKLSDAEVDANDAMSLEPDWADGFYRLGLVLEEEKRYADSLTALQKANTLKKHSSFDLKDEIKTVKTEAKQAKKHPYTVANFSF